MKRLVPLTIGLLLAAVPLLTLTGCGADFYYSQGNKAMEKGQFDKAIDNYRKAVEKDPKPEYSEALAAAQQQGSAAALNQANQLAAAGDLTAAMAKAQKALKYDPNNAQAASLIADLRQRLAAQMIGEATAMAGAGDLSNALAKAQQAIQHDPNNPQAAALAADLNARIGAVEQKRQQAKALANQGQFDAALDMMQQALNENKSMPNGQADQTAIRQAAAAYWANQAQERFNRGDTDVAEQSAQKALSYWPQEPRATQILQAVVNRRQADQFVRQAQLDLQQGRPDAALANLDQAARLDPNRQDIATLVRNAKTAMFNGLVNQGKQLLAANDVAGAIDCYQKAAAILPGNPDTNGLIAEANARQVDLLVAQARAALQQGQLDAASAAIDQAAKLDPNRADVRAVAQDIRAAMFNGLVAEGKRLAAQGDRAGAARCYNKAMEIVPGSPEVAALLADLKGSAVDDLVAQARAALRQGNFDAALAALDQAAKLDPSRRDVQRLLAETRQAKADALGAKQVDDLIRQAQVKSRQGKLEEALALLEQAARIDPNRQDVQTLLANTRQGLFDALVTEGKRLAAAGDNAGALACLEKANSLIPNDREVQRLINDLRRVANNPYRPAADQARAAKQWGNALVNYLLADMVAPRSVPPGVIDECAQNVRQRLGYPVGIVVGPDRGKPEIRQAADAVEAALPQHLNVVRPEQVSLLGKGQMRKVFLASPAREADLFGPNAVATAEQLKESMGCVVVVRVDELDIATTSKLGPPRPGPAGRLVDNPAYAVAKQARDDAAAKVANLTAQLNTLKALEASLSRPPRTAARNQQLQQVQADIVRVTRDLNAAQRALTAAQAALDATPEKIAQPGPLGPVTIHTKTCKLTATVQVIDTVTGLVLANESVDGTIVAVDQAGPGNPLKLPDDAAMIQQATARLIFGVETAVEHGLFRWTDRFAKLAQGGGPARQPAAIEAMVDLLFANPVATVAAERAMADLNRLAPHDNRLDLRAAFVARCQVLRPALGVPVKLDEDQGLLRLTQFVGAARPPANVQLPATVIAIEGKPVHTAGAFDCVINNCAPNSQVNLDVQQPNNQQARMQLVVTPVH